MSEHNDRFHSSIERRIKPLGNLLTELFHIVALFVIGSAIVWSAAVEFIGMMQQGSASISDILLLFIYLELGAMVGIYFKTNRMPVRFLIYIAITALTRMLIDMISIEHKAHIEILYVPGAILLLALAVLVIRFTSYNYPNDRRGDDVDDRRNERTRID